MIYFLTFILELGLLFFLSKKLINSLARTFYRSHFSHSAVVRILSVLFLPGTILHELAHLLVAGIMLIPVGELSVLPEVDGESVKLGSVQIGKADPIRMSLVGIAPVIFGVGAILFILSFLNFTVWWQAILGLYLIFEIGNSMFSSKRDLEGVVWFLAAVILVGGAILLVLYFWQPLLVINIWLKINSMDLTNFADFFKTANKYLALPIGLDFIIILLTKL